MTRSRFFVVYIREAHPLDGRSPLGGDGMPIVEDPVSLEERQGVAKVCMAKLELEPIPALVDDLDDTAGLAYSAHPDRLYLIARDGTIAYRGGPGPFGLPPRRARGGDPSRSWTIRPSDGRAVPRAGSPTGSRGTMTRSGAAPGGESSMVPGRTDRAAALMDGLVARPGGAVFPVTPHANDQGGSPS